MSLLEMELRQLNDEVEKKFPEYVSLKPGDTPKRVDRDAELTAWAERLKRIKFELKSNPHLRNSHSLKKESDRLNRLIRELLKNNGVSIGEILNNADDARQFAIDEVEAIHAMARTLQKTSIDAPPPPTLPHMTADAWGYLFPTVVFGCLVLKKLADKVSGKKS